jgi:hypothetical protein
MYAKALWACVAAVAVAAGARAQTYTIKIKPDADPGKSVTHRSVEETTGSVKVTDADGKVVNQQKPDETKEEAFTETVLERGDKGPKKFTRAYTKAPGKGGRAAPYEGRTVVFEWKGGRYAVSAEGRPDLPSEDLAELGRKVTDERENSLDRALVPGKPMKPGDAWPVDKKAVEAAFGKGVELDLDRTRAEARLLRAYKKDGKQFGVIELNVKLALRRLQGLKLEQGSALDLTGTLDTAIDGSSTAGKLEWTSNLKVKGQFEQQGMRFTVEMNVSGKSRTEQSAER